MLSLAARSGAELLQMAAVSSRYPLENGPVATRAEHLSGKTEVRKIEISRAVARKVDTKKYPFRKVELLKTAAVAVAFPHTKKTARILCRPPDKIKTYYSPIPKTMPISREMLDRRHIPFPVMSEYMSELARKSGTSYTNINFIGAFDPIPLHLAEKFVIDPTMGVLKFFMRKEPRGERNFARVVYGRLRDTGTIISAVFPVT